MTDVPPVPVQHAPAYSVGDDLIARWTPAQESIPRHLLVKVLEVIVPADPADPTLYRVQTNMGVTMVLPETDLFAPPAKTAAAANPPESALGEP